MTEIADPRTGELIDTDSIPGLAQVAGLHEEQIYRLSMVVEELQEDSASGGGSSAPWNWRTLRGHAAEAQWRELADWVGWLRGRYPLAQQVPVCWWRHPELVEELTALWLAWKDAYVAKHAHFTAPADWHARWLPEFLRRVGAGGWNVACEGDHKDRVASLYDDRRVDDEQAFNAHVRAARPERTEDEPGERSGSMSERLTDDAMQEAIASGTARRLGDSPDSPVSYDERYWMPSDDGWVAVENEDTVAFLRDAERRMQLADEAVRRAEES